MAATLAPPGAKEREVQHQYWLEHSQEPTVEAMMLDSKASEIDQLERPEVLGTLGCIKGKRVLELGAGIGRFTGEIAKTAKSVTACDFMEVSIDENRRRNGHLANVDFRVADVTTLQLPAGSYDLIFSNWLLMYLSDDEVAALMANALNWLSEDGVLFFRESCFRQSGDKSRGSNPTHYRNPRQYFRIVDECEVVRDDGSLTHFELDLCKCVDTYVAVKKNQNQICWRWRKVTRSSPRPALMRAFLDQQQYSKESIARYEAVFGRGYVSTGGEATTRQLVKLLDLQPGQRVLDIGCGIGGGDFLMSDTYGAHVHALDLSVNMILLALERAAGRTSSSSGALAELATSAARSGSFSGQQVPHDVTFEVADALTRDFPEASFDAVYSRDVLLHVADKPRIFGRILRWLKPGGRVLITDYAKSEGEPSPAFAAYIKQRGYDLHSIPGYGRLLEAAGFVYVKAEDRTRQFIDCLSAELARVEENRESFTSRFGADGYAAVVDGWRDKLARARAGEQRWGLFVARKPQQ